MSDSWQPGSIDAQMLKALKKHRRRILAGSALVIGVLLLGFLGWSFYLDRIVTECRFQWDYHGDRSQKNNLGDSRDRAVG